MAILAFGVEKRPEVVEDMAMSPTVPQRILAIWHMRRRGVRRFIWQEHGISYTGAIWNGFPPKKIDHNIGNLICNRYWDVVMKRSKLRWEHTSLSADLREFARRWA